MAQFEPKSLALIAPKSLALIEPKSPLVSLQVLHLDLKTKNIAVLNAEIALDNLRSQRDALLYSKTTGIVDKAFAVKAYIKSVFGATSTQYKQVSSIRFTRPQTKP
jgi:hypothetical protein